MSSRRRGNSEITCTVARNHAIRHRSVEGHSDTRIVPHWLKAKENVGRLRSARRGRSTKCRRSPTMHRRLYSMPTVRTSTEFMNQFPMKARLQLLEQISLLQCELNDERFSVLRLYRRDAAIYELSSAVNHAIACWLSKNHRPIGVLIERGRSFMHETPAGSPDAAAYYGLVENFFEAMQSALEVAPPERT